MRYKDVNKKQLGWQTGWNIFSAATYNQFLSKIKDIKWQWHDFKMPFVIKKTRDPMRTWTIRTEHNTFQLINGAAQILDIKVLEINKLNKKYEN